MLKYIKIFCLMFFIVSTKASQCTCEVVSLNPSITEVLRHLGSEENIVGKTRFCVGKKETNTLSVGGIIDHQIEAILILNPSIIIGTLALKTPTLYGYLKTRDTCAIITQMSSTKKTLNMLTLTGRLLSKNKEAFALKNKLEKIIKKTNIARSGKKKLSVFALFSIWPLVLANGSRPAEEVILTSGALPSIKANGKPWMPLSLETLLRNPPEIILVTQGGNGGKIVAKKIISLTGAAKTRVAVSRQNVFYNSGIEIIRDIALLRNLIKNYSENHE